MLLKVEDLYERINRILKEHVRDSAWIKTIQTSMQEQYNIPSKISFGFLTLQNKIEEADEYLLYCIINCIVPNEIVKIYTEKEIERYSKYRYVVANVSHNIKLPVIKVTDKQFSAAIDSNKLMKWTSAGLINYNERIQRPMQMKTKEGFTYYQISLNTNAVDAIQASYESGIYVPNTITLNLPETTDWEYNEKTGCIEIRDIESFDILDGYHRLVALKRINAKNKDWNYRMELRITYFTEEEARHFIWQEDQKTKMSKVDSESMNPHNYGNQLADSLNKGIMFDYTNYIDKGCLCHLLNQIYFNDKKVYKKSDMISLREKILSSFEELVCQDTTILDNRWNAAFTLAVFYSISKNNISIINIRKMVESYKVKGYLNRNVTPSDFRKFVEVYEEVMSNV